MSDLRLLSYYLRIKVHQGAITLRQAAYANKLLERSGLRDYNPALAPMVHTRPDHAFVVGFLSWLMEKLHAEHLIVVKHVLRYVTGTRSYGLHYARKEEDYTLMLIGYSDTDIGPVCIRFSGTRLSGKQAYLISLLPGESAV